MGTRNLTCVVLNGEYRIAQYGQWDGYPSGQGVTALDFLRSVHGGRRSLNKFKRRLAQCEFIPQAEIDNWHLKYAEDCANNWKRGYPYVTRDHGAEILELVYSRTDAPRLKNSIEFAGESLMCEYAYVADLDKGTFEVYHGFQTTPHKGERFSDFKIDDHEFEDGGKKYRYYPVKLWRTYRLNRLPSDAHFLRTADKSDEAA